ncbi:hypothetical protein KI688_010172 [Linnemannia hyalina]|uniref:Uncharacterized protein n=1 Tax=Linnemannia hyalina TaxID=64524 RepID=A0A9P7XZ11_9FUNG|nr:hypothetical protein KI688_010172 [Linnemannia hyalina]
MRATYSKMMTMLAMVYLVLCNTLVTIVRAQDPPAVVSPPRPQDTAVASPPLVQSLPQTPAQAPAAGDETGSGSKPKPTEAKPRTPPNSSSGTPSQQSPSPPHPATNTTGNPTPSIQPGTNTTTTPAPAHTPGPATNPLPPGTNNCLIEPFCDSGEECFVLTDGLVCLPRAQNWGYILTRNASGIPSVPGWSGPLSQLNESCTRFQMPASADKPGLALLVYDLIRDTLPKDLLLSRFDKSTTNWYTHFSNCEPNLACTLGICQPRPVLGESCTTSWQCNALALGLDDLNQPIPTANTTEMRCEYLDGNKSVNTTCQLLHRDKDAVHGFMEDDSGGFSAWHVIVPVVVILILVYFGTVAYKRRMRQQKRRKWTHTIEDNRDDVRMESYDEIH